MGAECISPNPVFPPTGSHRLVRTEILQQGDGRGIETSLSKGKEPKIHLLLCNASTVRIESVKTNKHQRRQLMDFLIALVSTMAIDLK